MSRLTFLADTLKKTLNEEYYDLYETKYLWKSFFHAVRLAQDLDSYDQLTINIPTYYKESAFTDNDFRVSKRRDLNIGLEGDHWWDYINDYYVKCRITLDVIIYKDPETKEQSLFLSGFQKRFVRDCLRKKEEREDNNSFKNFDFLYEKYTVDKLSEDLNKFIPEWTFYSRVFENFDKIEERDHIKYDEKCEIPLDKATLSDFMLFKDHIDTIVRFFELDYNK